MLTMIMAADDNGAIGYKGGLPWPKNHVDMISFIRHTAGKTCFGSSNIVNSLYPLTLRSMVVVQRDWTAKDWNVFAESDQEYMVLGGPAIYKVALPYVNEFILHRISGTYEADTYSPIDLPWANLTV